VTISPVTISPETISPETISPETISPETISPETISPVTISPVTISPVKSSLRRKASACWLVIVMISAGCGGTLGAAGSLRAELMPSLEQSRERSAPLVADAERALDDAETAEARGELDAAAEHRARARLLSASAASVASTRADEEAAETSLREAAALLEEADALDREAEVLEGDANRVAAGRAAREEALRALMRAEEDEARGRRATHVSLDDAAAMRNAARDLRGRARLLLAAAVVIAGRNGVDLGVTRTDAERLLSSSESAPDPLRMLHDADAAHDAARAALGVARRGHPVAAAQVRSLMEACTSEGFAAVLLERGVSIDVASYFTGTSRTPSREGTARLERLAALLASYPEGPVLVVLGGSLADARSSALMAALGPVDRLELQVEATAPAGARVILASYAPPTPESATRLLGDPPEAGGGMDVEAHPTPDPE